MKATWLESGQGIDLETLRTEGVLAQRLSTDPAAYQMNLDDLMSHRGYVTQDEVRLSPTTENLDGILAKFKDEHLHTEDEVRFILSGEGVFDIRSRDDRWMHVEVAAGDLIVVPERRYHRFFLTDKQSIHAVRLFKDPAGWTPHYRETAR